MGLLFTRRPRKLDLVLANPAAREAFFHTLVSAGSQPTELPIPGTPYAIAKDGKRIIDRDETEVDEADEAAG